MMSIESKEFHSGGHSGGYRIGWPILARRRPLVVDF